MIEPRLPWCPLQQREDHIPPSCYYHMPWIAPATPPPHASGPYFHTFHPDVLAGRPVLPHSFSLVRIRKKVTRAPTTSQQQPIRRKDPVLQLQPLTGVCGPSWTQPHHTIVPVHEAPRFSVWLGLKLWWMQGTISLKGSVTQMCDLTGLLLFPETVSTFGFHG